MIFEDLQVKKYDLPDKKISQVCKLAMRNIFNWNKQNTKACSRIHPGILLHCTFDTHHLMAVLNSLNHRQSCLVKPVSHHYTIRFDNCYSYPAEKTSMGFHVGQPIIFLVKLVKKPGGDTSIQNTKYYWWPAIHSRRCLQTLTFDDPPLCFSSQDFVPIHLVFLICSHHSKGDVFLKETFTIPQNFINPLKATEEIVHIKMKIC